MKSCILHLGMPKTASTSIQYTLLQNRDLLHTLGWEYPVFSCPQHGHEFFPHNDPLCRLFMPGHPFHVQRPLKEGHIDLDLQQAGLRKQLDDYCQRSPKLILSSEVLLQPPPLKKLKEYLISKGYDIKPVIYVRTPYSYRVSLYQSFLKFSQLPRSVIINNLQKPIVKSAIEAVIKVFGDTANFYPFNHLIASTHDITEHFLVNFIEGVELKEIQMVRENASPSWQATSLLDFIEEECPLYIKNIKNSNREHGDIKSLCNIEGEKFKFEHKQAELFKEIIEAENGWLRKTFDDHFCDDNYGEQIAKESVVWKKENIQSLLEKMPILSDNIQQLIKEYFNGPVNFASPFIKWQTISGVRFKIWKRKQSTRLSKIKKYFPEQTKRGHLIRKISK